LFYICEIRVPILKESIYLSIKMKTKLLKISLLLIVSVGTIHAQETIPLYPGNIPNSIPGKNEEYTKADGGAVNKVSLPTLSIFLPVKGKANTPAVIICPGGGYQTLVIKREGSEVALRFNEMGVAAFVLKYRIPNDLIMNDKSIGPLQDAQQAIKTVRERAGEWNIDPNNIGIMGFSAGGHLAASAGTHFNKILIENQGNTSLRPDFMILIYPVISLTDEIGSIPTRGNLLGKTPSQEQINFFSNELHVTAQTPPTFLIHAGDDKMVTIENSILFYEILKKNSVPAGLHVYPEGDHGFLIGFSRDTWMSYCTDWMREMKLIIP
jgi:acetyl esterase/lipase